MFSFFKKRKTEPVPEPQNTRSEFAELFIKELQRRGLTDPLHFDEDAFSLSTDPSKGNVIYLANAFSEYERADTSDAKARVMEFFGAAHYDTIILKGQDFESIRDHLILSVRERCYFEFANLHCLISGRKTHSTATREFNEDLVLCIAKDYSNRMTYTTDEDLTRWGISFDEVYQLAYRNLYESTSSFEEIQPGLYRGPWNDCYVPSRLAFLELIRELSVKGKHVAVAPNRNTLLITGSDDIEGQRTMLNLTREALKEPRLMSPRPLILKDGDWLNYFPQHDTPLFDDYATLRVESYGRDYAEQKDLLETLHKKTGEDIFVASYLSMKDKDTNKIDSFCVWTRDVLSLLPQTDLIVFVDSEKPKGQQKVCTARWTDAQKIIGNLMQPQGFYPMRYKVARFPDLQALHELDCLGRK